MILLRSFLSGHIRIKRTREYYDAGIGPNVPFGAIGVSPVVSQNFLTNTTVPSWLDVSATTGNRMLYDSTGKLTYAPNNLILYSQAPAGYLATGAATLTNNVAVAPDGTNTAASVTPTATTATHQVSTSLPVTIVGNNVFSVYAKANGYNYIQLLWGTGGDYANFYLSGTGSVSQSSGATSTITSVGNGWYRCSIASSLASSVSVYCNVIQTGTEARYGSTTGNGTSGILVWGLQVEAVTYQTLPSTYIPTTTAAYYGPRFDYDPSTLAAKGLLIEESRANIALQSNTFNNASWTLNSLAAFGSGSVINATTSPDGLTNAAQINCAAATSAHYISQNITWTAAIHVISFYVKRNTQQYVQITTWDGTTSRYANFDILNGSLGTASGGTGSITSVGNGWYCISLTTSAAQAAAFGNLTLTFAPASSSAANTGFTATGTESIYVYGSQCEAGSFPTSYIPTTTASVTRAADIIKLSGAALTAMQGDNASVITQYVQNAAFDANAATQRGYLWSFTDAGSSRLNARAFDTSVSGVNPSFVIGNGTTVSSVTPVSSALKGTTNRFAVAFSKTTSPAAISLNGANAVTGGSTFGGSVTSVNIGSSSSNAFQLYSWITGLSIYNKRLPDATLKSKSVVGSPL